MARPLVAFVSGGWAGWIPTRIAHGVLRYARERTNWQVRICEEIEHYAIQALRPDAAICLGHRESGIRRFAPETRYWIGVVPPPQSKAPLQVAIDDQEIGRLAAEHLIKRGFHHFAFYGLDVEWSHRRLGGFRRELQQCGVEIHAMVSQTSEHTVRGWPPADSPAKIGHWLKELPKPCGLFACHDPLGVLISSVCEELSLAIPGQIAVVSADNDLLMCESATVPMTSVDPGWEELGYQTGVLLHEAMSSGNGFCQRRVLPPRNVTVRTSTDILASCDPVVRQAVEFLHAKACEPITVDDLENHMGMSRRTLELRFHSAIGRTPWEELRRFRMERAAELLRTTDLKLSVVARRCGFAYVSYFSRAFLGQHGISPARYRKQHSGI